MFVNVLLNLSLVCVPIFFYSCLLSFTLTTVIVKLAHLLASRTVIPWPSHSIELTQREISTLWFTGSLEFCEKGELLNPDNATIYIPFNLNSHLYRYKDREDQNLSYFENISTRIARTVILDCPELSLKRNESAGPDDGEAEDDHSRTLRYVNWIAWLNSRQPSLEPRRKMKVWLRPPPTNNNGMYFGDVYCTALALAGNRLHPGTVQGILVSKDILTPLQNLRSSRDWETFTHLWKDRMRKFDLKLGLMLSWPFCSSLHNHTSWKESLDKFDELYFYRGNNGGAYINTDDGASAIVSKKYKDCKSLVAKLTPGAAVVKDALNEIHLVFRRFRQDEKYCLVYDERI